MRKDQCHGEDIHQGSCLAWTLHLESRRSLRNVREAMETKDCEGYKKGGVEAVDRENQASTLNGWISICDDGIK